MHKVGDTIYADTLFFGEVIYAKWVYCYDYYWRIESPISPEDMDVLIAMTDH